MRDPYRKPDTDAQTAISRLESLVGQLKNAPVTGLNEMWMEIDSLADEVYDLVEEIEEEYTDIEGDEEEEDDEERAE